MSAVTTQQRSAKSKARSPVTLQVADVPFESAAVIVLGRLQETLGALLKAASGPTGKCTDVEETFGIDAKLAWQIFRIATTANPLTVGANVPARVSLQRLLKAATRRRVPGEIVEDVSAAFDDFERFVQEHAENRAGLEAMLGALLPEEREKYELASKQAAFKGVSQIKGIWMDAHAVTFILHPSADGTRVDKLLLVGKYGLRRVRPGVKIGFVTAGLTNLLSPTLTLDLQPCDGPQGTLLTEFCSAPRAKFEVNTHEGIRHYWVVGDEIGSRSAVDLVMAEYQVSSMKRFAPPGVAIGTGLTDIVDMPTKRTTFDVFIHKDVYPNTAPQLGIFDTVPNGFTSNLHDPKRENDRLPSQESLRSLGTGLIHARMPHVPRYVEMLELAYQKMRWDPSEFRGYRLDVAYPFYGAQYILWFDLAEKA